jgi:Ni,Fe-hydrogenase I cytochrome b subunit
MDRLDMFFPFDPCLLKKSERCVTLLFNWIFFFLISPLHFCVSYVFLILLLFSIPIFCVDNLQLLKATFCPLVKSQNYVWYP